VKIMTWRQKKVMARGRRSKIIGQAKKIIL
jgi:hypothetical protein